MSGQPKQGLDWVGWDTRLLEDDERIDSLVDSQGWAGFGIYFYLCQKGYATSGYFYRWNYANSATTARKMGGGIKSDTVKQVVSLCLRIGLFDKRLFDREGILTNKNMQERYMIAVEKRSERGRTVESKYWLLDPKETKPYVIVSKNSHSLPENTQNLPENTTKVSKVKESKVKESMCVWKLSCIDGSFAVTKEFYDELTHTYPEMDVDKSLKKLTDYLYANPEKQGYRKSAKGYISMWLRDDNEKGKYRKKNKGYEATYDISEYESTSVIDEMQDGDNGT